MSIFRSYESARRWAAGHVHASAAGDCVSVLLDSGGIGSWRVTLGTDPDRITWWLAAAAPGEETTMTDRQEHVWAVARRIARRMHEHDLTIDDVPINRLAEEYLTDQARSGDDEASRIVEGSDSVWARFLRDSRRRAMEF